MDLRESLSAVVSAVAMSSTEVIVGGSGGGIIVVDSVFGDLADRRSDEGRVGVRRTVGCCMIQGFHLITVLERVVLLVRTKNCVVVDKYVDIPLL